MSIVGNNHSEDPLARFREELSQSGSGGGGTSLPSFGFRHELGVFPRFRGSQELRFAAVGATGPDFIIVETWDLVNGVWVLKRFILIAPDQVVGALEGLHEADRRSADLDLLPRDQWPAFPLPTGEGASETSIVKVMLDMYNERLNVKVTRTVTGAGSLRNWQWLSIGPVDAPEIMRFLIQGFDFIAQYAPPKGSPYDEELPF